MNLHDSVKSLQEVLIQDPFSDDAPPIDLKYEVYVYPKMTLTHTLPSLIFIPSRSIIRLMIKAIQHFSSDSQEEFLLRFGLF